MGKKWMIEQKREFSKNHVIFADALVGFVFAANVALSCFDKAPLSNLATAVVTVYGILVTGGYFLLAGCRDGSLNKHGLRISEDESGNVYKEAVPGAQAGGAKVIARKGRGERRIKTFSHVVMAGVMTTFFVGAALGAYAVVAKNEPVSVTLDYIMKLARIVALGYFIKAFGENIAKIVLSAIFGARLPEANDEGGKSE